MDSRTRSRSRTTSTTGSPLGSFPENRANCGASSPRSRPVSCTRTAPRAQRPEPSSACSPSADGRCPGPPASPRAATITSRNSCGSRASPNTRRESDASNFGRFRRPSVDGAGPERPKFRTAETFLPLKAVAAVHATPASSNCPSMSRRSLSSWRLNLGTRSLATSYPCRRPSRTPSRPESADPFEESMEPRNATAPNEPRGEGRHRGPRRDRHPPSRQDVGARDDRDDSEEEAEAEQARRGCQEARHGFQDDQGERVRERSHRKYGRALTRFEPAVQVRGRERGLQAPDDVDRDLEEDRARKYAGAVYAEKCCGGQGHQEGDRPELAEDAGDPARKGGPDRGDDEEARDR